MPEKAHRTKSRQDFTVGNFPKTVFQKPEAYNFCVSARPKIFIQNYAEMFAKSFSYGGSRTKLTLPFAKYDQKRIFSQNFGQLIKRIGNRPPPPFNCY